MAYNIMLHLEGIRCVTFIFIVELYKQRDLDAGFSFVIQYNCADNY